MNSWELSKLVAAERLREPRYRMVWEGYGYTLQSAYVPRGKPTTSDDWHIVTNYGSVGEAKRAWESINERYREGDAPRFINGSEHA